MVILFIHLEYIQIDLFIFMGRVDWEILLLYFLCINCLSFLFILVEFEAFVTVGPDEWHARCRKGRDLWALI